MAIDYESLQQVLQHKNIRVMEQHTTDPMEFIRRFVFEVKDKQYVIEWWANCSYLHLGDLVVPFTDLKQSNTWPTGADMNLQFYHKGDVCAILAIEWRF